ncbi:hypothetical protein [Larkinella rosea]|uniref:DUF5683 domain-containing protein n=1 Tax=Larkinella rosea TaxID=2025312 RepID=A0A3P1B989_9BACT|nr:hypothetical protein [Larkinella rosea]RRA97670.1 hypothetical protein EHT25_32000 [Larkinella rosea]
MQQHYAHTWLKPLLFFCFLIYTFPAFSQVTVTNIRVNSTDESAVEILYDIAGNQPADSVFIRIRGQSTGLLSPSARFISGDWGQEVQPGANRRILWKALENGVELDENIRATILVKVAPVNGRKPVEAVTTVIDTLPRKKYRPGGPEFALLSVVAPGVGNIFVQSPKPIIGHRLGVTAACYGLMIYGLVERKKSRDEYTLYEQQRSRTTAQPYYDRANTHHHRYYLATRLSGAIWVTDIVATFIKGMRNQKERMKTAEPKVSLRLGAQSGAPVAVFNYKF